MTYESTITPPTSVTTRKKYATRGQISVVCVMEVFKDLGSFGLGPLIAAQAGPDMKLWDRER